MNNRVRKSVQELERRGLRFAYVRSRRAGERVMASITASLGIPSLVSVRFAVA